MIQITSGVEHVLNEGLNSLEERYQLLCDTITVVRDAQRKGFLKNLDLVALQQSAEYTRQRLKHLYSLIGHAERS